MSDGVDDDIRLIRDSAGAIAPKGGDLKRIRALRFTDPGFDRAVWRQMAELGWLGLLVGEDAGGSGLGMRCFCALLEELGAGLVPEPLGVCAPAIGMLPERIRDAAMAGDIVVVPAWQEGSGALDVGGSTRFDGRHVSGVKRAVAYAQAADYLLVATASGCALVPRDAQGVAIDIKTTQDGGQYATVTFADAPGEAVAGDFAPVLDAMTLAGAAYLLGAMEQAFAITLDYLGTRKQFGRLIGSFQGLQHRAVDLKIQIELTRAVVGQAAGLVDREADIALCRSALSRAKARASDGAMLVARETIQFHGAIGITDEADIGLYARKILTLAGQCGSARTHRARYLAALEAGLSETVDGN